MFHGVKMVVIKWQLELFTDPRSLLLLRITQLQIQ